MFLEEAIRANYRTKLDFCSKENLGITPSSCEEDHLRKRNKVKNWLTKVIEWSIRIVNEKITDKFREDIKKTVGFIEKNNDRKARLFFNSSVYPKYNPIITNKPLSPFQFLFFELDEYLNNEGAKILGQTNRKKIVELYYSDIAELE